MRVIFKGTLRAAVITACFCISTNALPFTWTYGNSAPDPYTLGKFSIGGVVIPPYNDANSRAQISPTQIAETINVVLVVGDSLSANTGPTPYVVMQVKNQNLNVASGGLYTSADPMLGTSNPSGSINSRLGDKLIAPGGVARAVIVPIGISGSKVADWAPEGVLNNNLLSALRRINANGFTLSGVLWLGGPNDTAAGTSQAAYSASLAGVIATIRNNGGAAPIPIFVCQASQLAGVQSAAIRAAQAAAWNHSAGIWEGVDSDDGAAYPFGGDGTHHDNAGLDAMAPALQIAMHAAGPPF